MTGINDLSHRESRVLEAVIQMYIETAEPAGSRAVLTRAALGVSPATVRAAMGELERKGYLFHPHTSAGRIPTDKAYRMYVDRLMPLQEPSDHDRHALVSEFPEAGSELENILRDDVVRPSLPADAVLANAPARQGEFIVVPSILDER